MASTEGLACHARGEQRRVHLRVTHPRTLIKRGEQPTRPALGQSGSIECRQIRATRFYEKRSRSGGPCRTTVTVCRNHSGRDVALTENREPPLFAAELMGQVN